MCSDLNKPADFNECPFQSDILPCFCLCENYLLPEQLVLSDRINSSILISISDQTEDISYKMLSSI